MPDWSEDEPQLSGDRYHVSVWPAGPGQRLWRARIECVNGAHYEFREPDDALLFLYYRLVRPDAPGRGTPRAED